MTLELINKYLLIVNRALSVARAKGYNSFEDRVRIINRANIQNKK